MSAIDIVVRCRNEMPWTPQALDALARQRDVSIRVLAIDCRSTDGSREALVRSGATVVDLDPARYIPGAVLNQGMRETQSALVAFVNADAIALDEHALATLAAPFNDATVAATFGRQVARRDATPSTRSDTSRAFGERQPGPTRRGATFSMAASMVSRAWWERLPFDESLRYSEDVDWTHRVRALGARVVYAPDARFEHSHNYDLRAQFRRRRGEGAAERLIFGLGAPSPVEALVRPLLGSLVRDARDGTLSPYEAATRAAQAAGYFAGRAWGWP